MFTPLDLYLQNVGYALVLPEGDGSEEASHCVDYVRAWLLASLAAAANATANTATAAHTRTPSPATASST